MIVREIGLVENLLSCWRGTRELGVRLEGGIRRAINYDHLTGPAFPGDRVLLEYPGR